MNGTLRGKLVKGFSSIFEDTWGPDCFLCEDGWFDIIKDMCAGVQLYLNNHKNIPQVKITKCESKFGLLFIDYTGGDNVTSHIIRMCEKISYHMCEICGTKGELYSKDGTEFTKMQTLCNHHGLQKLYKRVVQ